MRKLKSVFTGFSCPVSFMLFFNAVFCLSPQNFKYADFSSSLNLTIPDKDSASEKKISGNAGVKTVFKNLDLRTYVTLPKSSVSSLVNSEDIKSFLS